jgi:hypothetical protein
MSLERLNQMSEISILQKQGRQYATAILERRVPFEEGSNYWTMGEQKISDWDQRARICEMSVLQCSFPFTILSY